MIDEKLIKDTIIELLDANVDKDTIFSTLKDIGVEEGKIEKHYNEIIESKKAKEEETQKTEDSKTKPKEEEISETKDQDSSKKEIDVDSLLSTPKEPKIEKPKGTADLDAKKQEDDLKQTTNEVSEINEFEENTKKEIDTNDSFTKQLSELESQVGEIKAQIKALTKIMKDILEENRNILNKL